MVVLGSAVIGVDTSTRSSWEEGYGNARCHSLHEVWQRLQVAMACFHMQLLNGESHVMALLRQRVDRCMNEHSICVSLSACGRERIVPTTLHSKLTHCM